MWDVLIATIIGIIVGGFLGYLVGALYATKRMLDKYLEGSNGSNQN